jgi:hypothetical protein
MSLRTHLAGLLLRALSAITPLPPSHAAPTQEAPPEPQPPCEECGGPTVLSAGPGRYRLHRGVICCLPEDLAYRECHGCGAEWLTSSDIDVLDAAYKAQRAAFYRRDRLKALLPMLPAKGAMNAADWR